MVVAVWLSLFQALYRRDLSDLGMLPSGCVFKAAAGIGDIDWGDIGKEVSRRLPFGMKAFVPLAEKILERVDGTVVFGVTSGEENRVGYWCFPWAQRQMPT